MMTRKITMGLLVFFLFGCVLFVANLFAEEHIDAPQAVPSNVLVGQRTPVTVTAHITPDLTLIRTGVRLVRYYSGGQTAVLSSMYDDGTHGDVVAGDSIFTAQVVVNEPRPVRMQLGITAAYRGVLRRLESVRVPIDVISPPPVITWSIPELTETIFPGDMSTVIVSFESDQDLQDVSVEVAPSLIGILTASPVSFASISAKKHYNITFTLTAPPLFINQSFGGTIRLQNGDSSRRVYVPQLPVSMRTAFSKYSDPALGLQYMVPIAMSVSAVSNAAGASSYLHDSDEEFPGGGITITKSSKSLADILAEISSTLTLTESTTHLFGGKSWTLNRYTDPDSGQEFIDAFAVVSGSVYQVSGFANPSVTNLLPALLAGFSFM